MIEYQLKARCFVHAGNKDIGLAFSRVAKERGATR